MVTLRRLALSVSFILGLFALFAITPAAPAQAATMNMACPCPMPCSCPCPPMKTMCPCAPTIASLRGCILAASKQKGGIDAQTTDALRYFLDDGQSAVDQGFSMMAIPDLYIAIDIMRDAGSTAMSPALATCMIMHAHMVLQALGGDPTY